MKEKVYEKFEAELRANPDNRTMIVISDELFKLCASEDVCGKLLVAGKTLKGAIKAMEEEAKKHRSGNVGVLSFDEGMDQVKKYFGISNSQTFEKPKAVISKKSVFDLI